MSNILFTILFDIPQLFNFNGGNINNEALYIANTDKIVQDEKTSNIVVPRKVTESLGVKLEARSALVLDRKSGEILFAKNVREKI